LQHLQTRTADYFSNVIGTWARWMTFMATGREAGLETTEASRSHHDMPDASS
jgi:hypothetical protein